MVGESRQTICSIETGQFCPTAKLALVLCIALDKGLKNASTLIDNTNTIQRIRLYNVHLN